MSVEEQPFDQPPEASPFDIFASLVHNDVEFLGEEVLLRQDITIGMRSQAWLAFQVSMFCI